jgi:hypothetical protein
MAKKTYEQQVEETLANIEKMRKAGANAEEIWQTIKDNSFIVEALNAVDEKEIRSYFDIYPQNDSDARLPMMLGQNVLKGTASMLGIIGDGESFFNGLLGDKGRTGFGAITGQPSERPDEGSHWLPTSTEINDFLGGFGLVDSPDLRPQPGGEDWAATGAYGLGAALPFILSGGSSAIPTVASGVGGALTAKAASEIFPDNELATFLGGLIGGGVIHGSMETLAKNAATNSAKSELQAALNAKAALEAKLMTQKLDSAKMFAGLTEKHAVEGKAVADAAAGSIEAAKAKLVAAEASAESILAGQLDLLGQGDKLDLAMGKVKNWAKLGAKDRAALVPDPAVRKSLDLATSERAAAIESAKKTLADSKKSAADELAKTRAEMRVKQIEAAREKLMTEQRIGKIQMRIPEKTKYSLGDLRRDVGLGSLGAGVNTALAAAIPALGTGTPFHAAGVGAGVAAIPYAAKYIRSTLSNPGRINALLLGAEGADAVDNWKPDEER